MLTNIKTCRNVHTHDMERLQVERTFLHSRGYLTNLSHLTNLKVPSPSSQEWHSMKQGQLATAYRGLRRQRALFRHTLALDDSESCSKNVSFEFL